MTQDEVPAHYSAHSLTHAHLQANLVTPVNLGMFFGLWGETTVLREKPTTTWEEQRWETTVQTIVPQCHHLYFDLTHIFSYSSCTYDTRHAT